MANVVTKMLPIGLAGRGVPRRRGWLTAVGDAGRKILLGSSEHALPRMSAESVLDRPIYCDHRYGMIASIPKMVERLVEGKSGNADETD